MISKRRIAAATLVLLALSVSFAAADDWKKRFKRNMASQDSSVRYEALRQLDPNDASQMKSILKILKNGNTKVTDWHIRSGVVESLAKATDDKAIETMLKEMERGNPLVQEAMTTAIGLKKDPRYLEALQKTLLRGSAASRRAAIRSLAYLEEKEIIDIIIDRFGEVKRTEDFREWVLLKHTLEEVTGKYLGSFPADWKNWWEAHKEKFSFDEDWEGEEERKRDLEKAEEEGRKAKEVKSHTRNVDLTIKIRGFGAPVLVIPQGGWDMEYFQPYMQSIEDICKLHYLKLPPITEFKNLKRGSGGIPFYPVDQLVDAFEEVRKQFKYKKFAILGHGITTTVAQRYLSKYPGSVSHMILVGAYSGSDAYGKILRNMEIEGQKRGDLELEHSSQSLQLIDENGNHKYEPKDSDEKEAIGRKRYSLDFWNPHDRAVHDIYHKYVKGKGSGNSIFPEFDTFKEKRLPVPTLILNGKTSLWTSVSDAKKIAKHYPNSMSVIFEKSTMMPFVEETAKFRSAVGSFFKKYPYRSGGAR